MAGAPDINADDFYAVLGLAKTATPDEIKRAYLALVREHTPERSPEAFKRIRQAYETLRDPTTRGQYDSRLDPRIQLLVNQAGDAMKAEEYTRAEQLYKQALLEAPGLDWIRNLLGICFLYQNRPTDAIAQYERILEQPTVDASMHANLAHAYRMVRRWDDAEREFKIAMSLGGERGFEYGVAMLDMIADRGEVDAADKAAQQLIAAAPKGSRAAAAYYAKQIELALRLNRGPTIPAILVRMTQGLETEEEKHIVAGTLGNVAAHLIAAGEFVVAERVAQRAGSLVPEDPGFDALEHAARLLRRKEVAAAKRLLRTHVAFAPGGVLQGLRPVIEAQLARGAVVPNTLRPRPRPRPAARSGSRAPWALVWLLFIALSHLFTDSNNGSNALTPSSIPAPLPVSDSTNGSVSGLLQEKKQTEYAGVLTNLTMTGKPIRAHMRVRFDDLKTSTGGSVTVSPPLSGSGPCQLRARADSVKLVVYSGSDTLALAGVRVADTISGSYGVVRKESNKPMGQWRAWLVSGTRIPARLDPW